eukprot:PhF_6_TR31253/c0_g1_i1/m.45799/K02183/CALM; calmodulin
MEAKIEAIMAEYSLTQQQVDEYRKAFALFDKSGDGSINAEELGYALRMNGMSPTEEEVAQMLQQCDADKSGVIEFNEFIVLMMKAFEAQANRNPEEEVKQAFMALDKDGDGFISAALLRKILTSLGEPISNSEVDEILRIADQDGDGQVTYEALINALC